MNTRLRLALPFASLVLAGLQLPGQAIAARGVIAVPKSSVRLGGVTERVDGVWAGAALAFDAGRFLFTASGTRGTLTASGTGAVPKRDVGEISLSGRYAARPWLSLDFGYVTRAFSSAAGYQRWDIVSVGASGSRDLGTPAVRAVAALALLPVAKIGGQPDPSVALRSDVGLSVAPRGSPLAFTLGYRVERFHFSQSAVRSEQFETLTLSIGVRAQRVDGRWRLGG
jgi:hypothetical protein